MNDLVTWIAKRTSWRVRGRIVAVDGKRYVPESIALALFDERQKLVTKLAKERARRIEAQKALTIPTSAYVWVRKARKQAV